MFGISDRNVLEHVEGKDRPPEYDEAESVTLLYNQTDPTVISDGVDRVSIVAKGDDRYLVDYWGYRMGYLEVTGAGVVELGAELLGDRARVPRWILEGSATDEHPEWVPADYDGTPTLACDRCGGETSAAEVVTPGSMDGEPDETYCPDCWSELRGDWHPGYDAEAHRLDRADELHYEATREPESIDVAELYELTETDDREVQWHALLALDAVAESRPGDVVDRVAACESFLESSEEDVREAALRLFATLADEYPDQVTPVASSVVGEVQTSSNDELLRAAITFVARVADADPAAVVDAAPKLAALLQESPPAENKAVLALARIAKEYPESILPVTRDLLAYAERADGSTGPSALAALGHVSKEYPNVAESTIPTLVDLLDAESFYVRANAAGLLAELADAYSSQLTDAIPRVTELLEDEDEDEKVRYNATSILARVAKTHPTAVEPAIGSLIGVLDDEFAYSRSNACWALGYLEAAAAESELERLADSDSSEEVRNAARWALQQLS